jgi:cyanate lyase
MKERLAEDDPPEWLKDLYGEYARKLAADSPAEAIRWAERIENAGERELTVVRIARRWLKQDEEAAEAWLEQSSLSERALRQARNTSAPDYLPAADPGDPGWEDEDSG